MNGNGVKALYVMLATAGRPDLLARTLASLATCQRPQGYRQTIVIENGAKRGAEDVVRSADRSLNCRYRYVEEGNKSAALNAGMADVGEDRALIVFTDDDVRFAPCTLTAYADAAAKESAGGVFYGGPTEVDYEEEPPQWLKKYFPTSARGWTPKIDDGGGREIRAIYFMGFNWAAYACDIRAAGGFDPNRGPGAASGSTGQEAEMQGRLKRAGAKPVIVSDARVWHYVARERTTQQWLIDRAFRHGVEAGIRTSADTPRVGLLWRRAKTRARRLLVHFAGERARFSAEYWDNFNRGLMHGARLQQENSPAVASSLSPVAAQPAALS